MEAINRANDLLYEQTDRMKLLKSKRMYCDVLHTRVGQIEDKITSKEIVKKRSSRIS